MECQRAITFDGYLDYKAPRDTPYPLRLDEYNQTTNSLTHTIFHNAALRDLLSPRGLKN